MASVDRRPDGRWRARWREFPGGPQKTKHFELKRDAQRFLDAISGDLVRGAYVDPAAGQITFRSYAEEWRQLQPHRASTATNVEQDLRLHAYPILGNRPLASIRNSHIQAMVTAAAQHLESTTLKRVYGRVVSVFHAAVRDRLIAASPCTGVRFPASRSKAVTEVLETDQVLALADAISDRYRGLILTAAGTGLRPGELFGLALDRIDFLRRELTVDQQVVRVRGQGVVLSPDVKTPSSYRTVTLAPITLEALAVHLEQFEPHPEHGVVFTNERGALIQEQPFASAFATACRRAGLPDHTPKWTPHDLRHYHASLLIAAGEDVKTVQERLGHSSATTTLDTYTHLFRRDRERTRSAVEGVLRGAIEDRRRAAEDQLRTERPL